MTSYYYVRNDIEKWIKFYGLSLYKSISIIDMILIEFR